MISYNEAMTALRTYITVDPTLCKDALSIISASISQYSENIKAEARKEFKEIVRGMVNAVYGFHEHGFSREQMLDYCAQDIIVAERYIDAQSDEMKQWLQEIISKYGDGQNLNTSFAEKEER